MSKFVSLVFITLIVVLLSSWLGYRYGKDSCQACLEVVSKPRFRKEYIKPIIELALVYRNNQERTEIELPPSSEFAQWLAQQFSHLGMNKSARYEFNYQVNYRYGVDLDRNPWDIKLTNNNQVVVNLPEVELVGCPAIDTGSIAINIKQTSAFVFGERDKIPALLKRLTEESVKAADNYLTEEKPAITALVNSKVKRLIKTISQMYGVKVDAEDIQVNHLAVTHKDMSLAEKLNYYGCSVN